MVAVGVGSTGLVSAGFSSAFFLSFFLKTDRKISLSLLLASGAAPLVSYLFVCLLACEVEVGRYASCSFARSEIEPKLQAHTLVRNRGSKGVLTNSRHLG